jgi:hypothetical protein
VRWIHAALFVLGGALFAWLVASVGLDELWRDAARLGWGVVAIIAVEGFGDFLHACAWRLCFHPEHRASALRLWGPHLAGASINYVTPTATLGGEVVRGTLVPRQVPAAEVTSSLAINKLTAALGDTAVALVGVGVLLFYAPVPGHWRLAALAGALLLVAGVAAFIRVQRKGRLAGLLGRHRGLARLLGEERSGRLARVTEEIDARIAAFHADGHASLLASAVLHVLGGGMGAVQLFFFLWLVGAPSDPATVLSVFVIARAIDLASFFVPARLGIQEGARMLAMSLVGIEAALGLLFSLVLRLEQVTWAGVGFGAYAGMLWQRKREARAVGVAQ